MEDEVRWDAGRHVAHIQKIIGKLPEFEKGLLFTRPQSTIRNPLRYLLMEDGGVTATQNMQYAKTL